ncbi:hypothetical protein DFH28DRAFT_901389 [Melampsora americana]|nr:hypothetical protein DFH28DRAFT_901389 [Melampsora americana]
MEQLQHRDITYSELITLIQTLQNDFDRTNVPQINPPIIFSYLLSLCTTEAMFIFIESRPDWEETYTEVWHHLVDTNGRTLDSLMTISDLFKLDLPIIHHLPIVGSETWMALYSLVRLVVHGSHLVLPQFDPTEEREAICPTCDTSFRLGQRLVRFPCHVTHRIHETCLTELASHTPFFSCPICGEIPLL